MRKFLRIIIIQLVFLLVVVDQSVFEGKMSIEIILMGIFSLLAMQGKTGR